MTADSTTQLEKTTAKTPPKSKNSWLQRVTFWRNAKTTAWQKTLSKKQSKQHSSQRRKLPKAVRIILFPILNKYARIFLLLMIALVVGLIAYTLKDLPSPANLGSGDKFAVSSQILDRNGKLLYEIFADENRTPIKIDTLPPYVYQASVSIEDRYFFHHFGFDFIGITRAVLATLTGKRLEGGSTITQQLVKNALLTRDRTWERKAKEALLTVATEALYSKMQILEMYLNYIPYGGTAVGIESASHRYFNKSAKDLDLAEASMLAGLPQSPSTYSPFGSNPAAGKSRQGEVLRRMVEDKYITQTQADQANAEVLHFALSRTDIRAPHFVFYVKDLLIDKYGIDKVEKGGLRVTTTLDLDIQNQAQASLSAEVDKLKKLKVGNGAGMVVKPDTGEILAMIGSKDYFDTEEDGQVNVTIAQRQPGSSIKPIMYATGMQEKLLNPGSYMLDIPTCFQVAGQKDYCPKNYDGSFHGPISIRQSLGNSLNIPAVKSLKLIGVPQFIQQANKMGISTWTDPSKYGLSLTLGGGEVKMIDMAQAFSVLANEGVKVPLTPILKVEDYHGTVLEKVDTTQRQTDLKSMTEDDTQPEINELQRVMDRAPAYLVSHIMQDNAARTMAFGPSSKLVIPKQIVSVKTGTTNDLKDNWTVGFTPDFLTITWVGNNDDTPMNQALVSGITGAAPIWNDIMSFILKDKTPHWQEKPEDVMSAQVCVSGFPPTATGSAVPSDPTCQTKAQDLYWTKGNPSAAKYETKNIWIHNDSGIAFKAGDSTDNLSLQSKTILSDPVTGEYCSDCAQPVDENGKPTYSPGTLIDDTENPADVTQVTTQP